MRRPLNLLGTMTLMSIVLLASSTMASVASAASSPSSTQGTLVSFALTSTNAAAAPTGGMMAAPGDWITITGGGTFDPQGGTIHASGAFVHYTADDTVHCRGTWTAASLTDWTDFGTAVNGEHGGVVSMLVTHQCTTTGMTHTDIPMTVTSTRVTPPGSSYVEGTTVAEFTQPTSGTVVIRATAG